MGLTVVLARFAFAGCFVSPDADRSPERSLGSNSVRMRSGWGSRVAAMVGRVSHIVVPYSREYGMRLLEQIRSPKNSAAGKTGAGA